MARKVIGEAECIKTGGAVCLTIGKTYILLEDEKAGIIQHCRVIDDRNDNYLYPSAWFNFRLKNPNVSEKE
jgi:hypothetical protein